METAGELFEMFASRRDFVDGIGRDEETARWLLNAIGPYSKRDLASAIGALHLMPINMERAVRLHRLAHACSSYEHRPDQPTITLNRLRAIANAQQLDALVSLEDPFENPFTEYFGFNGEDFVVLNGPVESETFVLGLLLDAISASSEIPDDFRASVILALTSLLRISTLIASRAGLAADMLSEHGTGRVELPSSASELRTLQAVVTFSKAQLATSGVDVAVISRFSTAPGTTDPLACLPVKCSFSQPFLDAGDDVIVIQPTAILFALVEYILTEAGKRPFVATLAASFHDVVVKSVIQSFREMHVAVVNRDLPARSGAGIRSTWRARIDVDKEIPVVIETDTVVAWDPSEEWKCEPPADRTGPLAIHVVQSLARPFLHVSDYGDAGLLFSLTAADLETIATVEQRDPLAIWYFVHHTRDFLRRTQVSGSTLSFFQLYRGADHSYDLFDDIVPTFMPLGPYGAGELRLAAQRIRRQHLLASYSELLPEDIPLLYDSKHLPLDPPRLEIIAKLPPFRRVHNAAVSRIADEVGPEIARRRKLEPGPIFGDGRRDVLNDAVKYLFEKFETAVAELSPRSLAEQLILRSEALIREGIVHRGSLANRKFHFTNEEAFAEELREELSARYRITATLRFMIEYVAARPPEGREPLSLARLDELMALAAQMIDFAGMSDAVHFNLAEVSMSYLPTGRLGFRDGPYTAYSDYLEAVGLDEITRIDAIRQRRTNDEELSAESIFAALDPGVTAEFGVSGLVLRRFFQALTEIALAASKSWMFTGRHDELLMKLLGHGFELATSERLIDRFALARRTQFMDSPPGFRPQDVYPWRADRRYSHRYRPLVLRSRDGGIDVVFGARHIMNAWRYLVLQLLTDRYPTTTFALKSVMGRLTKQHGDLFNRNVAQLIRARSDLEVREQVKKLKLDGRTLRPPGDIDVLVIDRKRKRLIALECKNIAPAHDPHSQWSELQDLVDGDKSIGARHRARTVWLRANAKDLLAWLGIGTTARWRVDAAIVTSERIPGPYLQRIGMPVVSIHELRRMLDAGGALSFES